jgi:hypothetical protein
MALCAAIALAIPAAAGAATPGNIAGKVTNAATGGPVASLYVCAYTATTNIDGGCAYTGPNGEYKIENLAAETYKVEFDGYSTYEGSYLTQWYSGKSEFATANPVVVTEGNTTTGIDAAVVERGGKISGTVTDAGNGSPINDIQVCVANASYPSFYFYEHCEKTNSSGQYTLSSLEAGSYRVSFSSPYKYNEATGESELEGPNYVSQFYNGKAHGEEGDLISVSEGSTTSGINAALQAGAAITGTVTDATTGAPLRGVDACAWGASNFYCDSTNASGQYSITTAPTGSYKVEFDPEKYYVGYTPGQPEKEHWQRSEYALAEYATQYWNNKFTFAAAESITATGGGTTANINAKLTKQTEPAPPPGTAQLKSKKAKVTGSETLINLTCLGTGPCKGNLALTVKAKGKKKAKAVTIGKASFGFLPGTTAIVAIKLTGTGKSLVGKAGKKGLKVEVGGTGLTAGSVTLVGTAKKSKQHKGKAGKHNGGSKKPGKH